MSETKSQSADDGQVDNQTDDGERELLQLTDAEVHAFELGVKEIARDIEPTESADELVAEHNPRQRILDDVDRSSRTENGVFVYTWTYVLPHQNDLLAAVAENPLVELVEVNPDTSATLVHTDYVDEYVEWNEQEDGQ